MNRQQELFLVQARSDFTVFKILSEHWKASNLPECHALHYLQMATENLAKARFWQHGPTTKSHLLFTSFFRTLTTDAEAQRATNHTGKNEKWKKSIGASVPFAARIQQLVPGKENRGPNPEYPWPPDAPVTAPASFTFKIWHDLNETASGRQFLKLLDRLFATAEAFL